MYIKKIHRLFNTHLLLKEQVFPNLTEKQIAEKLNLPLNEIQAYLNKLKEIEQQVIKDKQAKKKQ